MLNTRRLLVFHHRQATWLGHHSITVSGKMTRTLPRGVFCKMNGAVIKIRMSGKLLHVITRPHLESQKLFFTGSCLSKTWPLKPRLIRLWLSSFSHSCCAHICSLCVLAHCSSPVAIVQTLTRPDWASSPYTHAEVCLSETKSYSACTWTQHNLNCS